MFAEDTSHAIYNELMERYHDYDDCFVALCKLKTTDEAEINKIYGKIKENLIQAKFLSLHEIIVFIFIIMEYNNRYYRSYWILFKKIYEEYHPKNLQFSGPLTHYFFYKEYGIITNPQWIKFINEYEKCHYTLDVHEKNTVFRAIMEDDKNTLLVLTGNKEFNQNEILESPFYPLQTIRYSLLELCCYHGAVSCFKILLSKYNLKITQQCLQLAFLSGVPDILNECLKYHHPDDLCLFYASVSHNNDFVTFLVNEYKMELREAIIFQNPEAFFIYLDMTHDFNTGLILSSTFRIPSLCKYIIAHGANVNAKGPSGVTTLHGAVMNENSEITKLLISHGADVNAKDSCGTTPLHNAALSNNIEYAQLLLSQGADINAQDIFKIRPIHYAMFRRGQEMVSFLISHGAILDEPDINSIQQNPAQLMKVMSLMLM